MTTANSGHPEGSLGPGRPDIRAAYDRLRPHIRRTPVAEIEAAAFGTRSPVCLKLEHLQHSGSFKARGALNSLMTQEVPDSGVVAASGGNHGAAVAWAADRLGHGATIFVPTIASPAKVERLRNYGADVQIVGSVFSDSLEAAQAYAKSTGATTVHAYDQDSVLAGAGTVAMEFEGQCPDVKQVVVACGGGGLSGGIASWLDSSVELIAVETPGTATFRAAKQAGHPTPISVSGLLADSLGASELGSAAWAKLNAAGAESVIVSDAEVTRAQQQLWERCRLVVEPAAAAPLAALTNGSVDSGKPTGVILCGANLVLGAHASVVPAPSDLTADTTTC